MFDNAVSGPLSVLCTLTRFDYLLRHEEYEYEKKISIQLLNDKFEFVFEEIKAIKNDKETIQSYRDEMVTGFFEVDITLFKNELIDSCD